MNSEIKKPDGESMVSPEREGIKRIDFRIESEIGKFSVIENEQGMVEARIELNNGNVVNFNDYLPEEYRIIGNKIVWEDINNYLGLSGTDSSICDSDTKTIIISESQLRKDGWQYVLTLLHEIGHAVGHDPQEQEEMSHSGPDNPIKYKHREQIYSTDEKRAWVYAARKIKEIAGKVGLSLDKIFMDDEAIKSYIRNDLQCKTSGKHRIINIRFRDISEEDRRKLLREILPMWELDLDREL